MDQFAYLESELHRLCPGLELRREEPMGRHTSFRIGGPVRLMALPHGEKELSAALSAAARLELTPAVMGNGTNLLAEDGEMAVFVIKTCDGMGRLERTGEEEITCGSGVLLSRLAMFALKNELTGLEFAHGIPGSLGGGVVMNAGAYGGELKDVAVETRCLTVAGEEQVLTGEAQGFSYRRSAFSGGDRIIVSSVLRLKKGKAEEIKGRMEELAARRRASQPLEYPSAGSTFKRPADGYAAALIDQCGLKGLAVGGAQVSEKHAGFVINRGGATCADVLRLTDQIRETVLRRTGIELELEVKRFPG